MNHSSKNIVCPVKPQLKGTLGLVIFASKNTNVPDLNLNSTNHIQKVFRDTLYHPICFFLLNFGEILPCFYYRHKYL